MTSPFINVVSGSYIEFIVASRDVTNAGTYTLTVTSTLNNYNPVPPNATPTSCQSTFTLTAVNPCLTTLIVGTSATTNFNFIQFEGYNMTTSLSNLFSDTASIHAGGAPDLCGNINVTYNIDSNSTTELLGANNEPITFSPLTGRKVFGNFVAQ
jgi:hypothetical protein